MNSSLFLRDGILVIRVNSLQHEFENRLLLRDIEQFTNGEGRDCIVDLSSIRYLNSSGINFLVNLYHRCSKSDKQVHLQAVSQHVRKLLELTRLSDFFPVVSSC